MNLNSVNANAASASAAVKAQENAKKMRAEGKLVIAKGMTVAKLAESFHMSKDEFMKRTGLKNSDIKAGQVLSGFQTAAVPAGKGLMSIAKAYGMKLSEFCYLNNISENYKPAAGEVFLVAAKEKPQSQAAASKKAESTEPAKQNTPAAPVREAKKAEPAKESELDELKNLSLPEDIAKALKKSSKMVSVVGKEKFNIPFGKINKDNVTDVIKKYNEISPRESLVEMIADEWGSSKESRMNTIAKLFDTLAQSKNVKVSEKMREEFNNELKHQFNSFGWVNTKKLDKMINELVYNSEKPSDEPEVDVNQIIKLENGKSFTVKELKKYADLQAPNKPERPYPVVDENGNITADVNTFYPTHKGTLSGKTIIINAGHGGYNPKNGAFDPGTVSGNDEEWTKNTQLTKEIVSQLTEKGAKVILMNGHALSIMKAKEENKNADMFISIHCDSQPKKPDIRGQRVIYRDDDDKRLAEAVEARIDTHAWIDSENCKLKKDDRDLAVLRTTQEMPSILIETGFQSNKYDLANINSSKFRSEFSELLIQGIEDYFINQ